MRDVLLQLGYMQSLLSDRGKNIFTYLGFSALGATKNSMKRSPCYPMERRFLTSHASSMVGRCIAPLSASSRIGCSSSSRLRGDCSSGLIYIAFVPPLPWDCALTYRTEEEQWKGNLRIRCGLWGYLPWWAFASQLVTASQRCRRLMALRWRRCPSRKTSVGAKLPRYAAPSREMVAFLGPAIPFATSKARVRGCWG